MANKLDLVSELEGQAGEMQTVLDQVKADVGENTSTISQLEQRHRESIREGAMRLLPDLNTQSITRLTMRLPGFITADQIGEMARTTKALYQGKIDQLLREGFSPELYAEDAPQLKSELETVTRDRAQIGGKLAALQAIPDFVRLIKAGYGTKQYKVSIWQRQYYRDWEAADNALDEVVRISDLKTWDGKTPRWAQIIEHYNQVAQALQNANMRFTELTKSLSDLESKNSSHRDLVGAVDDEKWLLMNGHTHKVEMLRSDGKTVVGEPQYFNQ